jgi:hypothetical protein
MACAGTSLSHTKLRNQFSTILNALGGTENSRSTQYPSGAWTYHIEVQPGPGHLQTPHTGVQEMQASKPPTAEISLLEHQATEWENTPSL